MRDLNNNSIFIENSNVRRERIVTRLVADEIAKELERTLKTCSLLVQTSFVKKAESRSLAGEKSYWSDRLDWTDIARRVSVALGDRVDPAGLQSFFHHFTRDFPFLSPDTRCRSEHFVLVERDLFESHSRHFPRHVVEVPSVGLKNEYGLCQSHQFMNVG